MKLCVKCKIEKDNEHFYKNRSKKDGLESRCKACEKERETKKNRNRKYKKRNIEACEKNKRNFIDAREAALFYNYGIRYEQYNKMVEQQQEKCLICGKKPNLLVVDHCHKTGEIRGLLCKTCNRGLGMLGDTKESLFKAYSYLAK